MGKTARQRLEQDKQPKMVILEQDFAGIKAGQRMLVATPQIVDTYIRKIPYGETRSIERMRRELARRRRCDASCPVSTAIFIRISAQAAIDAINEGASTESVSPFWRLLTSRDKISKKLSIDPQWLDLQRSSEQA